VEVVTLTEPLAYIDAVLVLEAVRLIELDARPIVPAKLYEQVGLSFT